MVVQNDFLNGFEAVAPLVQLDDLVFVRAPVYRHSDKIVLAGIL